MALASVLCGLLTAPLTVRAQFTYTTNNNSTITINRYTGPGGAVIVPDQINGLAVTRIGDWAFYYVGESVTSVTIPPSVTSIGDGAFSGTGLTNVRIPDSVISLGIEVFSDCRSLGQATIGNNITSIADYAFNACYSLTNVTMGSSVTSIGGYAFAYSALPAVTIPGSTTSIGGYAFGECESLTRVTIPDNVTTLGALAFGQCHSLTNVTLGHSVSSIGYGAFDGCPLSSVTIPDSVTDIGASAFADCGLISVYFMGNPPSADPTAFDGDSALAYYLPGTTGWSELFAGLPTALWLPQIQIGDGSFGVRANQFGFNIAWASGQTVVVEAATNLSNPVWLPMATNVLTSGTCYFSDAAWANFPQRFYRLTTP